jgi:hypothetical protein
MSKFGTVSTIMSGFGRFLGGGDVVFCFAAPLDGVALERGILGGDADLLRFGGGMVLVFKKHFWSELPFVVFSAGFGDGDRHQSAPTD